jgi:pentatricopeptide repeat protein
MLYSSVISSCAKSGEISRALKLFQDMRKLNVSSVHITSYNALMSACASSDSYWKDAIHVFDDCLLWQQKTQPMYQILIYTRLLLLSVHVQEVSFVFICKEKCPGITITLPCSNLFSFVLPYYHHSK